MENRFIWNLNSQSSNQHGGEKPLKSKIFTVMKRIFDGNFFFKNFLIPIAVLALYSLSFAFVTSKLLTTGVNYVFVSRLWKYLLILLAVVGAITFGLFMLKKNGKLAFSKPVLKLGVCDLLFLLLPMTPIAQYIINNQSILSPVDIFLTILFFGLFSSFYIFAIPALLGYISSKPALIALSTAFVMTIINMALLSQEFNWFNRGSLKIQLGYFGIVFIISWLLFQQKNRNALYLLAIVYFVANSGLQVYSLKADKEKISPPIKNTGLQLTVNGRTPAVARNIYLLVYDAYVANETMLGYGIDNSAQEDYLRGQGFALYPHTYTIGAGTLSSMSKVLNTSTEYLGDRRRAVSGDGVVQNTLKSLGYKTYGVFANDSMFRGIGSSYDYSIPEREQVKSTELLINAILIGEFRFNLGFDKQTHAQYIENKQGIFKGISRNPAFVYAHSNRPSHSQNSGACLPDENSLYEDRLKIANIEMQQDIETITANDPEAIIIIAGDHGPYLTKNCYDTADDYTMSEINRLDIQDRFGTFLAIRWPTADFEQYDDIDVLQDIFPAVFAYLYDDPAFLKLKLPPVILDAPVTSNASVENGMIVGGIDDGEPLFLDDK